MYRLVTLRNILTAALLTAMHQLATGSVHYLFSHGLADDAGQATRYLEPLDGEKSIRGSCPTIMEEPCMAFNYPDASLKVWRANLAQDGDIAALEHAYNQVLEQDPEADIILIGVSRGAATALGFLGTANPSRIRAVVLESPFDSVDMLITRQLDRLFANPSKGLANGLHKRLVPAILRGYRPDGPTPADAIPWIPTDLPILVVCSLKDGIVPVGSSIAVYHQLRETAHDNVHLLELDRGEHARIKRSSAEGKRYRNVVHAFFKSYDLPHHDSWAQKGLAAFAQTQPTRP